MHIHKKISLAVATAYLLFGIAVFSSSNVNNQILLSHITWPLSIGFEELLWQGYQHCNIPRSHSIFMCDHMDAISMVVYLVIGTVWVWFLSTCLLFLLKRVVRS